MISFNPNRWSHLVFLSQKQLEQQQTRKNGVTTVELCLTSNLVTNGSDNVSKHHIHHWLQCVFSENCSNASTSVNLSQKKEKTHHQHQLSGFHTVFKGTSMTRELWLFSCHTKFFLVEIFGEIGSQKRCDNLYPILKEF